ncbi:MAG: mercuric reductase [Gemmatimonadales bacterium]
MGQSSSTTKRFDAIIIGSGQAGNPLAHNLADRGWSVALIEHEHLGGSCVNFGCTPTKAMIASAEAAHEARHGASLGVHVEGLRVALGEVVARKNGIVARMRDGEQHQVERRPAITLVRGTARFTGTRTVTVDGARLTAKHIFIDVGTSAAVPPIPGLDRVSFLDNRSIMELTVLPEHLLVLGGSAVGLEFAQMFRRFGSRVTVVETENQIVPREDDDVAEELRKALEAEGVALELGARVAKIARNRDGIEATVGSRSLTGSHLLVATGRRPNTAELDLAQSGVETDAKGWIRVNEYLETSAPGVWALGDVTGGPAFTHISYHDYQIVFHNLFEKPWRSTKGRIVPYAIFTDPELGRVGITEREARESGRAIRVGTVKAERIARAIERGDTRGLLKVVIDAGTERIIGAAVLSYAGGELIQTMMALMMADAPWTVFKDAVFIHPTMTEGFFSLMASVKPPLEAAGQGS